LELAKICQAHARPWFERYEAPNAALNWFSH